MSSYCSRSLALVKGRPTDLRYAAMTAALSFKVGFLVKFFISFLTGEKESCFSKWTCGAPRSFVGFFKGAFLFCACRLLFLGIALESLVILDLLVEFYSFLGWIQDGFGPAEELNVGNGRSSFSPVSVG